MLFVLCLLFVCELLYERSHKLDGNAEEGDSSDSRICSVIPPGPVNSFINEGVHWEDEDYNFRNYDNWLNNSDVNWDKFVGAISSERMKDVWKNQGAPCVGILFDSFEFTKTLVF